MSAWFHLAGVAITGGLGAAGVVALTPHMDPVNLDSLIGIAVVPLFLGGFFLGGLIEDVWWKVRQRR